MMSSPVEEADRITRGRALAAPFVGLALLSVQQWLFFGREWDAVSPAQLALWLGIALIAFALLLSGGAWLMPRRTRRLVDDDISRANRQSAISAGFVMAMLTSFIVFAVSPFEPLSAQRAAHIVASLSLGVSFVSFGLAESRVLD